MLPAPELTGLIARFVGPCFMLFGLALMLGRLTKVTNDPPLRRLLGVQCILLGAATLAPRVPMSSNGGIAVTACGGVALAAGLILLLGGEEAPWLQFLSTNLLARMILGGVASLVGFWLTVRGYV